ncbi:MAG: phosphoribosylanthranilate isomerase [Clostridia bacterium]|nr:phosphoribosylanthranilate isomerase [Clostridia bacterium]
MKVKICGINTIEFAAQADKAGADYLGLLVGITHVAEDKISVETAKEIVEKSGVDKRKFVMVTHLVSATEIAGILQTLGVVNVQLHDAISVEEIQKLRALMPDLFMMKAVHVVDERSVLEAVELEKHVDAILLDSRTQTRIGGTGIVCDWDIGAKICKACQKPVFLAGGLNGENVAQAVAKVNPYGVDANSGVEKPNGDKDEARMCAFVRNAKA